MNTNLRDNVEQLLSERLQIEEAVKEMPTGNEHEVYTLAHRVEMLAMSYELGWRRYRELKEMVQEFLDKTAYK